MQAYREIPVRAFRAELAYTALINFETRADLVVLSQDILAVDPARIRETRALLTLLVFGVDLSLYAFVGIIMLIGIVKKNAIMMIDFALERQRKDGAEPAKAIFDACVIRFRPIMMTTMAALVGTLPIAIGWGAGAEVRRPLGLAVVGGVLAAVTLLTGATLLALGKTRVELYRRYTGAAQRRPRPARL